MRAIVVAAGVVALAGCAFFRPAPQDARGTVIVSATGAGPTMDGWLKFRCQGGANGEIANHGRAVRVSGGAARSFAMADYFDARHRAVARGTDFPRASGQVHALNLPSGACEFFSYSAAAFGIGVPLTKTVIVKGQDSDFSIRFDVPPNGTAYIGSFNVSTAEGALRYSYEDQYERDVAVLKAQDERAFPLLDKQMGTVTRW